MADLGAITITSLKWVPPFAQGQVRDHRLRWALKEAGWVYSVEQIDPTIQESDDYREQQPFGQVPVMREEGRPTLFESGAIVLDIAERSGAMLPADEDDRLRAKSWLFAALNSLEPYFMEIAMADFFIEDADLAKRYRNFAQPLAAKQLARLSEALGEREWLVGADFSIADLMTASVTKIVSHTDMIAEHANLERWQSRCFARSAYREAIAEQCANFEGYGPEDMGWPADMAETTQGETR